MDLIQRNKEMLETGAYNRKDTCEMLKISQLKTPNDYDLFLIACALCQYDIPDKDEALDLRMKYYVVTNGKIDGYEHTPDDYYDVNIKTDIICTKTGEINKYGHHLYEINSTDKSLVSDLWAGKKEECLSYVDNKTYDDKIVVSIRPTALSNFLKLLDKLMIKYDRANMEEGIVFHNESDNQLIDISTLDLPFEPYEFQIEDTKKIMQRKRYLIGNEQGTGKTLEAILIGLSLVDMPKLVICPASLRLNWKKEILQAKNDVDVQVLYSKDMFHMGKDWTIIGYGSVKKFLPNLQHYFKCMFVDECQNCKAVDNWGNPKSQRAEAVMELSKTVEYCYLMSGTPMPSHNKDLFNSLKMLQVGEFNWGNKWCWLNYGRRYCAAQETNFGTDFTGNSNSKELHDILSKVMVRHLRKEVLPDLKKVRQFIPIEPALTKEYKEVEQRLYNPRIDFETGRVLDTYMGLAMTGRALLSKIKAETAIDLAETLINADESVVIVVNFVESANYLKDKFKGKCCEIRGGMTDKAKQQAIDDFQDGKYKVCILNMVAGGVGVTLTKAHTEIIIDYSWVPADMAQVEDRICRSGQTECCMIYYVYCNNSVFDQVFIRMLSDKSSNIDTVVDGAEEGENSYNLTAEKLENSTYMDLLKAEIKAKAPEKPKRSRKKKSVGKE